MRRAARVDATHRPIVEALRAAGALVVDLSGAGRGVPDLLIGWRGIWVLYEVKLSAAETKDKRRRTLRGEQQRAFHAVAAARGLPCYVVRSQQEALDMLPGGYRVRVSGAAS